MTIVRSALENLSGPGKPLKPEPADAQEISGLKRSALVRLSDAAKASNSLESRFDLAYNSAHSLCLAALRAHGFRPTNRYIVFQALPHTLGLGPEVWRVLDKCHHVRNIAEYEGYLNIDERLVEDLITACRTVAAKLDALKPIEKR